MVTGDAVGCHGATESPVVSFVTWQLLVLVPWILYFTEVLQNAERLALSFPLH